MSTTVTDKVKTAGRLIPTPGIQQALIAFRSAFAPLARSIRTRRRSMIEGRKVTLETGQLKLLPAALILLVTSVSNSFFSLVLLIGSRAYLLVDLPGASGLLLGF
uniref:Uncharacterized protein n=1 Tax=Ixodes ricinus TaxID=34613 RepID=A0A6B0UDE6_IXORI